MKTKHLRRTFGYLLPADSGDSFCQNTGQNTFVVLFCFLSVIEGEENVTSFVTKMWKFLLPRENNVFFYIFVFFFYKKRHLWGGKCYNFCHKNVKNSITSRKTMCFFTFLSFFFIKSVIYGEEIVPPHYVVAKIFIKYFTKTRSICF